MAPVTELNQVSNVITMNPQSPCCPAPRQSLIEEAVVMEEEEEEEEEEDKLTH